MKKLTSLLTLIICFIPMMFFVSCKQKEKCIDLPTYFENIVPINVFAKSSLEENKFNLTLKDFTHNNHKDLAQYQKITFTGKNAWVYKMTIKKIEFEVFSNQTTEIEITTTITNLKNGDTSAVNGTDNFTKTVGLQLKKDKSVKACIEVNDYFDEYANTSSIILDIASHYYFADGENTNLKIDILNFKVYANHDLSKIK